MALDPKWRLDRRASGHLFWRRESSQELRPRVKFRCDVEVVEFSKESDEYSTDTTQGGGALIVCATCIAALAVTVILPWLLIGT